MGISCGCLGKEAENEISTIPGDISLAKSFPNIFSDYPNGQIAVPVVDLEKEFSAAIDGLYLENRTVDVMLCVIVD